VASTSTSPYVADVKVHDHDDDHVKVNAKQGHPP
jgi:hypothetical protein